MSESGGLATSHADSGKFFATVWPERYQGDSESMGRRKLAVRAGHVAMAAMLIAAVGSTLLTYSQRYTSGEIIALCFVTLSYIFWNLTGTRGVVMLVLWDGKVPPPMNAQAPPCGATAYFTLQIVLAIVLYGAADRGLVPNLIWLVLLPPIAYAVFMLEWRGITLVAVLMMAALVLSAQRWHGVKVVGYAALAFSFAVLFTIVFTLLAVHSEKSRHEVQRLAGELGDANRQLREHAVQAEELASSRERNRIAREIHDSLGHYLTVANMQLQAAQTLWSADPTRAREAVAKAQSFTQEGLEDIRQSVASLRNSPLEKRSLAEALHELAMPHGSAEPCAEFQIRGAPRRLSSPAEISLYRAGQEGLTNARKHSRSSSRRMVLDFRDPEKVSVHVIDDGIGATQSALPTGFGLLGLRERAQLLGGRLTIETAPTKGFTMIFEVPG